MKKIGTPKRTRTPVFGVNGQGKQAENDDFRNDRLALFCGVFRGVEKRFAGRGNRRKKVQLAASSPDILGTRVGDSLHRAKTG
jgi:hypothetical protein